MSGLHSIKAKSSEPGRTRERCWRVGSGQDVIGLWSKVDISLNEYFSFYPTHSKPKTYEDVFSIVLPSVLVEQLGR